MLLFITGLKLMKQEQKLTKYNCINTTSPKFIKEEHNLTKYNFVNTTKSNKSIHISHQ